MNQNLFRKESLKKITSPDQLDDYIHVARPSVWIVLSAVIVLLLGIVCWGVFGTIETVCNGVCEVKSGSHTYIFVSENDAKSISEGMTANIMNGTAVVAVKVKAVDTLPSVLESNQFVQYDSGLAASNVCYKVGVDDTGLPEGIYRASIKTESISPISFIIH